MIHITACNLKQYTYWRISFEVLKDTKCYKVFVKRESKMHSLTIKYKRNIGMNKFSLKLKREL